MKKLFKFLMLSRMGLQESACQFASVKYGAIITDLKGSIGGHTFKGTAVTGVMQTKINRSASGKNGGKITKSDAGRIIRPLANTSQNATNWRTLSPADQASWTTAAPSFPFLNKYGQSYTPSGFQLYMSVNNQLLNIGQPVLAVAPAPGPIADAPAFTCAVSISPPIEMYFDIMIPAGYLATLYAGPNQSFGRSYERGLMKAIAIFDVTDTFPMDITPLYNAIYGSFPSGSNIWMEVKITKADAGRTGIPYRIQYQN